jgi:phosphotransferase system IIB component
MQEFADWNICAITDTIKMTAIEKVGFKGNVVQVKICMKQQILSLVQANICDVLFA